MRLDALGKVFRQRCIWSNDLMYPQRPPYLQHTVHPHLLMFDYQRCTCSLSPIYLWHFSLPLSHALTFKQAQPVIPLPVVQWPLSVSAPTELSRDWTSPAAPASLCPSFSHRSEADWSTGRSKGRDKKSRTTSEKEDDGCRSSTPQPLMQWKCKDKYQPISSLYKQKLRRL